MKLEYHYATSTLNRDSLWEMHVLGTEGKYEYSRFFKTQAEALAAEQELNDEQEEYETYSRGYNRSIRIYAPKALNEQKVG